MAKKTKTIEVVPYDSNWPKQFEVQANALKDGLGKNLMAIHHVGSTAVPGLVAKPKIDIIAVVSDPEASIEQLKAIGYNYRGEYNIPMHYGFTKRGDVEVNLHVYEIDNPEIELNLSFRNYLRAHPDALNDYAKLKLGLLEKQESFEKNNSMFTGYNLGKNHFIQKLLQKAGFNRLRFVICTHFDEWVAAKHFRQKYFFDKVPVKDPYEWTFDHNDHKHFILYKGVSIIGYAHIQLWPKSRAAIRIIVIDEDYRGKGYGGQFLSWMEEWLKRKGYKSVHTESSPEAVPFYKAQDYREMPFNDPDGYESDERDTPMGKVIQA